MTPNSSGRRGVAALVVVLLAVVGLLTWPFGAGGDADPAGQPSSSATAPGPDAVVATRSPRARSTVEPGRTEAPAPEPTPADAPAPKSPLEVTVLRSDGSPAAGATVLASSSFVGIGDASSTTRTTDGDGKIRLPVSLDKTCVYAWLGEEAGEATLFGEVRTTIRLDAAIPLRGRVVERSGRPIAGATVSAYVRGPARQGWSPRVTTGVDGRFELPPVRAATFNDSWMFGLRLSAAATGFPDHHVLVMPDTPRPAEFVLVLMQLAKLRGRVVTSSGEPVQGEVVSVGGNNDSDDVITGADGRFEQTIERDGADVTLLRPRWTWDSRAESGDGPAGWGCARSLGHMSGEEGDMDLGDIVVSAGSRMAGTVVDEDGRPLARASVTLCLGYDQIGLTTSGPDGKFAFDSVGDDPHRLEVSLRVAPEPSLDSRDTSVEGVRGGDVDVRVALTGAGTTVVRFVDSSSNERIVSKKGEVRFCRQGDAESAMSYLWLDGAIDRWRYAPDAPGAFDMTVKVDGYEPSGPVAIVVLADRETIVDVRLRRKQH